MSMSSVRIDDFIRCPFIQVPRFRPPERRKALQPRAVHRNAHCTDHGHAGPAAHRHQLREAAEPHNTNVDAPVYPADQWIFQEDREPRSGHRLALHALQLLPDTSDVAGHSCDGGWGDGSVVVDSRPGIAPELLK